jgi:hypothetical protein
MIPMPRPLLLPLLLLASACASAPRGTPLTMGGAPPSSLDLAGEYRREGEIHAAIGRGAGVTNSYGRYRVVGPDTSFSVNAQGRWGGTIARQAVLLDVAPGRITGAGVDLDVRRDGEALVVTGLWRNARLDMTFKADHIGGTPGAGCSLDLRPAGATTWRGFLGCPSMEAAVFQLEGAAADVPDVAMPQWLFAFLAALPEGP